MTTTDVLERLASRLDCVKLKNGGPGFMARCPAHEDVEASLSVDPGTKVDGAVLHCFAGCDTERILTAMGLTAADLFADQEPKPSPPQQPRRLLDAYDYCDADGTLLWQVQRFEPKSFGQRRPVGNGEWVYSLNGTKPVLYRLPGLIRAKPDTMIVVVEGEKDADRLCRDGFVATTHAGGTGNTRKMLPVYVETLAGRHVAILPDNDGPGKASAEAIAAALDRHAASVRVVELVGLAAKGDVSDWLDADHTADQLRAKIEITGEWTPGAADATATPAIEAELKVVRLDQVQERPIDWLWRGWLARQELSIHAASPGLGKTTVSLALTAAFSTGGILPDGTRAPVINTLLMFAEDSLETTVAKGLRLHGADMSRIYFSQVVLSPDGTERAISLDKHLPEIERMVQAHDIGLVILDPLTGFSQGTDRNNEGAVRDTLTPLRQLAERHQFAVLGIAHFGKPNGSQRNAMQSVLGSTGYVALARTVIASAELPENQQPDGADLDTGLVRITQVVKSNLDVKPKAITWRRPRDCPITWRGESDLDVETVLSTPRDRGAGTLDQAKSFLQEQLDGGSKPAKELEVAGAARDISWRTLKRAKTELDITSIKLPNQNGAWLWQLPSSPPQPDYTGEGGQPEAEGGQALKPQPLAPFDLEPAPLLNGEGGQPEHLAPLAYLRQNQGTNDDGESSIPGQKYEGEASKGAKPPYTEQLAPFDSAPQPEPETETFIVSLYS